MAKKNAPFDPYQGNEEYVFISYAHKDSRTVFDAINRLHNERYRIWYDEGIEAGAEWPQVVADRLLNSSFVIIFISRSAIESHNCRREIHYAVSRKKSMLVVTLDDSVLPPELEMQLSVAPKITFEETTSTKEGIKSHLPDSLIGDGITGYGATGYAGRKKKNLWLYISIAAIGICVLLALYIIMGLNGLTEETGISKKTVESDRGSVSVTEFKDNMSMQILLGSIDSKYVHICGRCIVSDPGAIRFDHGRWYVQDEEIEKGDVDSLEYFSNKNIEQLSLINEKIRSLSGIEDLTSLTYLDLSDNPVSGLSGIEKLTDLETLYIVNIPADTDLSVLMQLKKLRRVYVSIDMKDAIAPLVDNGVEVVVTAVR